MNIQEFLNWRQDCFFCGGGLDFFPEIKDASWTVKSLSLLNDWMTIESKFVKLSIHIVTGEVVEPEGQEQTIDAFLGYQSLRIRAHCIDCNHNNRLYQYSAKVSLLSAQSRTSSISYLEELLSCGKYMLTQYWDKGFSKIDFLDHANFVKKVDYDYPLMDLKKISPEQLEHKLKTYVVFS